MYTCININLQIKTPGDVYNWLNISVIPSLFPEFDINGAPLHWTVRQFTNGYNNFRLGPPRLRQLRMKNSTLIRFQFIKVLNFSKNKLKC
jgi:hypothetical protein